MLLLYNKNGPVAYYYQWLAWAKLTKKLLNKGETFLNNFWYLIAAGLLAGRAFC